MAYCTTNDLKKVLPETELIRLTDDAGAGTIQESAVTEAMESGAWEINVYIGRIVKLPISSTPPVLAKINADIAIYNLFARVATDVPETWRERYKNAIRLLESIAEGKVLLDLQPQPDPPDNYPQGIRISARTKLFSVTEMDKF